MSTRTRIILLMILDSFLVFLSVYIAYIILTPHAILAGYHGMMIIITSIVMLILHHIFASHYRLYHKVWSYASVSELSAIIKATVLTMLSTVIIQFIINDFTIYRRLMAVTWLIYIISLGGSRFVWRMYRDRYLKTSKSKKRTLIVGAGSAGAMIARQLTKEENDVDLWPVIFVDDSLEKQGLQVYDIPVAGQIKDIERLVQEYGIYHIVIAIPSLKHCELQQILDQCKHTKVPVQMIPRLEDLMTGRVSVSQLKKVEVEDLLGRDPVKLDMTAIKSTVTKQVIMVTGAGGSIGSELCRQLMRFSPKKLLLVGHGEYSIYKINMELKNTYDQDDVEIIPLIGDVQDKDRMNEIMAEFKPAKVYHAAAHKHVPLMEYNPHEAVKNNIQGTKNVAEAAHENDVNTFVLVSTDKAVNPTNVMGATKRCAEIIVQNMNKISETTFVAVRFGNVLGSRGSVIPLFKSQIQKGGPITVTDPEMTRYFMTIPEASRLVIQAGTLARGGEVFVLDMGEPVKIVDLARNLIQLSGFDEAEIGIEFSGLRPGEKMYEELLDEDEVHPKQVFEKIHIGKTDTSGLEDIKDVIENFESWNNEILKDHLLDIAVKDRKAKDEDGRTA